MQRLGRYQLLRLLGQGGQGTVYEAFQHGPGDLRRHVALKVLNSPGSGDLLREARIGGWLRHTNLVDLYEVGEIDGKWFCALEFCPGGDLAAHLPLPGRAVVEVGVQVCAALQYAHDELGLVHLDLKPQNLLITGLTVKVADLGAAVAHGFRSDRRGYGTPGYMAPEQVRGEAVDARTDVYSLGVVLHELATGLRAGASTTLSMDDAGPIPADQVECAEWLAPIVSRCLEYAPRDRYASMAEVATALAAAGVDGPGLAEHLGVAGRTSIPNRPEATLGRAIEADFLANVLELPGIVVVKGPAGVGKSHLARHAVQRNGGPMWWLGVAEARGMPAVLQVAAAVLGLRLDTENEAFQVDQVGRGIAARGSCLVVLDDVEGVPELPSTLERWRALAPFATLLVTSRAAVGVPDARLLELAPLEVVDGVALLQARALDRGVDLADEPVLHEIVRRLDGLPLALVLAAGRLGVLSPADLLERLGLSLLRSGADVPDRQATLRGALDCTWEHLPAAEQTALSSLSVFRGGFWPEAARAVLGDGAPVEALLAHSLLVAGTRGRLRMLEPVREYAAEHLRDAAEADARHGQWFATLGSRYELDRSLALDVDNAVIACRRALARGDGDVAAATARAAWGGLERIGPIQSASELADEVLASPCLIAPPLRVVLGIVAGRAHLLCGRPDRSDLAYAEAEAAADHAGDPESVALVASCRVETYTARRDLGKAASSLERALSLALTHELPGLVAGIRSNRAILFRALGRLDEAAAENETALALARADRDLRLEGRILGNLGNVASQQGRREEALALRTESLSMARRLGDRRHESAMLCNLAEEAASYGEFSVAQRDYEAALQIAREIGSKTHEELTLRGLAELERLRAG